MVVLLGAIISFGIAMFALGVMLREFQGRWAQIAAALAFDERAFIPGELRLAAAPRPARQSPVRARHPRPERAAA